jgi:RNA-directed DNA polymerase
VALGLAARAKTPVPKLIKDIRACGTDDEGPARRHATRHNQFVVWSSLFEPRWSISGGAEAYSLPACRIHPPNKRPISATITLTCSYCPSDNQCHRCASRKYNRSLFSVASASPNRCRRAAPRRACASSSCSDTSKAAANIRAVTVCRNARGKLSPFGTSHSNRSNTRDKITKSSKMPSSPTLAQVTAWPNLLAAFRAAAKGKRSHPSVAGFEHQVADHLLTLQSVLRAHTWQPGPYTHFRIHEPKNRLISAAPFADRVVHHALCNIIAPLFEPDFIPHSYANRPGKGTHRAVDQFQLFARRNPYCLRLDIVRHFPSLDHQLLLQILRRKLADPALLSLAAQIIASGEGVLEQEYAMVYFPGDDLFAALRPRGLPIGNLTSQFWSNCYLNPLDQFIRRELRCGPYLRYVDDMALFASSKQQLWEWKSAIVKKLETLRLTVHAESAQVAPVDRGIPWLGFVIFPSHRLLKARKAVQTTRHLGERFSAWRAGEVSFAEFDASVQGWINHVRYADTWGLRRSVLERFVWPHTAPKSR